MPADGKSSDVDTHNGKSKSASSFRSFLFWIFLQTNDSMWILSDLVLKNIGKVFREKKLEKEGRGFIILVRDETLYAARFFATPLLSFSSSPRFFATSPSCSILIIGFNTAQTLYVLHYAWTVSSLDKWWVSLSNLGRYQK